VIIILYLGRWRLGDLMSVWRGLRRRGVGGLKRRLAGDMALAVAYGTVCAVMTACGARYGHG